MGEVYHDKLRKQDIKKAQDEKFNWITKSGKNYHRAQSDISINCITYNGKPFNGISFSFRNEVWQFFGERVEFAIYKNRILFRSASNGEGMSFTTGSQKCTNKYFKVKIDENTQILKDKFIGDYELKYDSFYELYYIEADFEV